MEIKSATLFKARLPLKKPFKHGSHTRRENETIFLKLTTNGLSGWGEALPREYVTEESIEQVEDSLSRYSSSLEKNKIFPSISHIEDFLNELEPPESRNMAALCALDMALLDLYGKSTRQSVSSLLYHTKKRPTRITSAPMGLDTREWKKYFYVFAGLDNIKLKISSDTPPQKINRIGSGLFKDILEPRSLRLDANGTLFPNELEEILKKVNVPIWYVEQPFPAHIPPHSDSVKLMADESLVSLEDAQDFQFDAANIRIGKNGGLLRSLEMAQKLSQKGIPYMLGSLVGETSLLSAALLHLASGLEPIITEGCYSSRILKTDPVDNSLYLTRGGKVSFDYNKPGLGISINPMIAQAQPNALF
jgi:L-Ala-D/L-Glu epimerase